MKSGISPESLQRILSIGVALTAERNMNRLLDTILTETMAITGCDAGTLYLLEDGRLHFKIMRNRTLGIFRGGTGDPIDLPPVDIAESYVAAYVVIHRRMENIPDVYHSDKFDFSGTKRYDALTGYRCRSMMVIPLMNSRGEAVGSLQLINAMDENGEVVPFSPAYEEVFRSISSQAAIAVDNMRYNEENKALFQSVVEVLAAAIDERSHYNANHTRQVVELTRGFVAFLNEKYTEGRTAIHFSPEEIEQLVMAAWLHDIGKIITPLEIMDKATRLGGGEAMLELRFEAILAAERVRLLEGAATQREFDELAAELAGVRELCFRVNTGAPTTEEEMALLRGFGERTCVTPSGVVLRWLETEEIECLAIRVGTLTPAERRVMEKHVEITCRLLGKIRFSSEYRDVPTFASDHHEKLNGHGYPAGKAGGELPAGTRILTVMDVFEALTARDRPYKKPIPLGRAFEILDDMAGAGELDVEIVGWLKEWEKWEESWV